MQPNIESQNELNSIIENLPDFVKIRKKIYKIKWLHPITIRKINQIILKEGNDDRASHQTAACIILNNFFKLKFIYPFLWRWFYYVKQYTEADLTEVIAVGKNSASIVLREYHIDDRYEGYDNGDDEERSVFYPSRTRYGAVWDFAKEHSWLMQPKRILFWTIPMYHYNCTMTNAQLDLIISDKPVSYLKPEKKKFGKPSAGAVEKAIEKFKERNKK